MSTKKTTEKKQSAARKRNFIDDFRQKLEKKSKQSKGWELALNIIWVFMMLVWVAAVLVATQLLLRLVLINLMHLDQASMSTNALQTLYSALVYVIAFNIFVNIVNWFARSANLDRYPTCASWLHRLHDCSGNSCCNSPIYIPRH